MTSTKLLVTAAAAVAGLALSACGGVESTDTAGGTSGPTVSSPSDPAHDGHGATDDSAAADPDAEHSEADVMFAQMMLPHHEQAIEMSDMLLAKDDIPAEVVSLAEEIKAAQGPEIQQLTDWLEEWGEPVEPGDHHGGHDMSAMEGMLSDDELGQLADAEGTDAARLFLEQMIAHHEGAVTMAQEEVSGGTYQPAVELAQTIITTQQTEIDAMHAMANSL